MHSVIGFGINDTVVDLAKLLNEKGVVERNKRTNSEMLSIYNVTFKIHNPNDFYLDIPGRKSNIFALMAETLWVLSGNDEIDPYLSFFLKRAKDFSDDGKTWRGGYGKRLFNYNQLNDVIEKLKADHTSRQGVVSIYDPSLDSKQSLKSVYGLDSTVDLPCNNLLYFYITDGKLNLHLTQRSGDIIWGLGSINIFEWLTLQNLVAAIIGVDVGYYTHYVNNLHVYKSNKLVYDQFLNVANTKIKKKGISGVKKEMFETTKNIEELRSSFNEVYQGLCDLILSLKSQNMETKINIVNKILKSSDDIPRIFKTWVNILVNYITKDSETPMITPLNKNEEVMTGLYSAIQNSFFIKKKNGIKGWF